MASSVLSKPADVSLNQKFSTKVNWYQSASLYLLAKNGRSINSPDSIPSCMISAAKKSNSSFKPSVYWE